MKTNSWCNNYILPESKILFPQKCKNDKSKFINLQLSLNLYLKLLSAIVILYYMLHILDEQLNMSLRIMEEGENNLLIVF